MPARTPSCARRWASCTTPYNARWASSARAPTTTVRVTSAQYPSTTAPKSSSSHSPAATVRALVLACGSALRGPLATIVGNGWPSLPWRSSAPSNAPAIASSVCPTRTLASGSCSAPGARGAAARLPATSPGSFRTRSRSTNSPADFQRHAAPGPIAKRSASLTLVACASNPSTAPGPIPETPRPSSLKRRSQTLVASISTRATAPACWRACSSYRKSVTSSSVSRVATATPADPLNPVRYRMLDRDVTSSASNPSVSRSRASAACRSGLLSRLEMTDQPFETQAVAVGPEPRDDANREIREQRTPPLRLTRKNVRQMHFDERDTDGEERVPHRQTRMRERGRVDHGPVGPTLQSLNRLDELAFMIRLDPAAFHAERARPLARQPLDLGETRAPVDLRFALSQQIQVGAVQHGDVRRH